MAARIRLDLADYVIMVVLGVLGLVIVYPFVYVISVSISDPDAVLKGQILLFPKGANFTAYRQILRTPSIWVAYKNTIVYAALGTAVRVVLLLLTAYPLSRSKFPGRNGFMIFITFTMLFSGGLIPTYLVVHGIGLVDTIWAMIIPGAIGAYHVIIVRTFFQTTIPESLTESADLDGANDLQILTRIVMPLSTPIIAVMSLFIAVGIWNNFFQAIIYLRRNELYPLTVLLREIVILSSSLAFQSIGRESLIAAPPKSVQSATLIVSVIPILCAYPFVQRYFVRGIMIGAIKG